MDKICAKSDTAKLFVFLSMWLLFWWGSTYLYGTYIDDIGATYWWQGVWAFPFPLLMYWGVEKKILSKFAAKPKQLWVVGFYIFSMLLLSPIWVWLSLHLANATHYSSM